VIDDIAKGGSHSYAHPFHYHPSVDLDARTSNTAIIGNSNADLHITIAHPLSGISSREDTDYGSDYVEFRTSSTLDRLVLMTVLVPVRNGDSAAAVQSFDAGNSAVAVIDGTIIRYDRNTREAFVE
jgi:hypothetical protein